MTHEVFNQSPPLTGTSAWRADPLLVQLAEGWPEPVRRDLEQVGRYVRSSEAQEMARLANAETPKLRTHDRQGHRIDVVDFHPAYHALRYPRPIDVAAIQAQLRPSQDMLVPILVSGWNMVAPEA